MTSFSNIPSSFWSSWNMNLATLNHCNGLPSNIWVLYSAIHQLPTITFITAQSITCSLFLDNVSCAFIFLYASNNLITLWGDLYSRIFSFFILLSMIFGFLLGISTPSLGPMKGLEVRFPPVLISLKLLAPEILSLTHFLRLVSRGALSLLRKLLLLVKWLSYEIRNPRFVSGRLHFNSTWGLGFRDVSIKSQYQDGTDSTLRKEPGDLRKERNWKESHSSLFDCTRLIVEGSESWLDGRLSLSEVRVVTIISGPACYVEMAWSDQAWTSSIPPPTSL